jgi:dTDP-4-amino-4,6-dideoxygalactose transaminase
VLSTDDASVAEVGRSWGAEVPFLRDPALSTANATSVAVGIDAIERLSAAGQRFDLVVLVQPTSPGGGGMITTDDGDLAGRARHLTTQARLPGRVYRHDEVGYNYRLSNLAAALGLAQLEDLPRLLAARRATAARYDDGLDVAPGIRPARRASWADPSFWLYTITLEAPFAVERDRVLDDLAEAGIDARPIWTALHLLDPYRDAELVGGDVADDIFATETSAS